MVTPRMIVVLPDLQRQDLSISEIARRTGLDRKRVRKYLPGAGPVECPSPLAGRGLGRAVRAAGVSRGPSYHRLEILPINSYV